MVQSVEEFNAEAVTFLEADAVRKRPSGFPWGEGDDAVLIVEERTPGEDAGAGPRTVPGHPPVAGPSADPPPAHC